MRISSKRQVSIPKKTMEALHLKPGDEVEFQVEGDTARMVPIKTIKVTRDQAWFWSHEWQEKEKEANHELATGQYKDFDQLEQLLRDLHGEN